MIESDTTLFYRAVAQPKDLFGELTRYTTFVEYRRRGEGYREQELTLAGLSVSSANFYLLQNLGDPTPAEPRVIQPFADPRPTRHQVQVRYNDSRYRFGVRYRGGWALAKDWQLGVQVEGRLGRDRFTEGVYTQTIRTALHLEKRWRNGVQWSLMGAFAPTRQGIAGMSSEEAFTLLGTPYYNPDWGFWQGEVRSARERRTLRPLLASSLRVDLSKRTSLRVVATAEWGTERNSSLGWFDTHTSDPDHYRSLPSAYEDPEVAASVAERWLAHDSRYTQINWEELYLENSLSNQGAYYVVQDRVDRMARTQLGVEGVSHLSDHLTLNYGMQGRWEQHRYNKEVRDLLGADYLLDIDYYLIDDDTYANNLQNDLRNPSRRVSEGERFGYDYALEEQSIALYGSAEYHTDRWQIEGGIRVAEEQIVRRGYYEKELFPGEHSFGASHRLHFMPYRLALQAGYAFSPRRHLSLQLLTEGVTPEADHLFLQPQYNNRPVDNPALEKRHLIALNYRESGRLFEWSATAFWRMTQDRMEVGRYYDDLSSFFCDQVVRGIGEGCYGVEVAARLYLGQHWRLDGAAAWQEAYYAENPLISLYADTDNRPVSLDSRAYIGECRPGATPQYVAQLGASYWGGSWGVRLEFSLLGGRYAHPDWMRRTARVAEQAVHSEEAYERLVAQERLDDALRADLSAWKRFRIGDSQLTLSLMVDNLLGDQSACYTAYESHRIRRFASGDGSVWQPLESQRRYASPRSFYLSLSLTF